MHPYSFILAAQIKWHYDDPFAVFLIDGSPSLAGDVKYIYNKSFGGLWERWTRLNYRSAGIDTPCCGTVRLKRDARGEWEISVAIPQWGDFQICSWCGR